MGKVRRRESSSPIGMITRVVPCCYYYCVSRCSHAHIWSGRRGEGGARGAGWQAVSKASGTLSAKRTDCASGREPMTVLRGLHDEMRALVEGCPDDHAGRDSSVARIRGTW